MFGITDPNCYFYRKNSKATFCDAKRKRCFLCFFRVPKIDKLEPRDYVGLANLRVSQIMAFVFSALALVISSLVLVLQILQFLNH